MGIFERGDIVIVQYPYSDLTQIKIRPAFVVKDTGGNDIILCAITTKQPTTPFAVPLSGKDMETGVLSRASFAKADKIVTLDKSLIQKKIGTLKEYKTDEIIEAIKNAVGL
jgi:mRNA interferase MazF